MADPNPYDQFDAPASTNPYDQFDTQMAAEPQTSHKFGLMDTWPARLAKGLYNAVTLPGDVLAGKVNPLSQEGIERAADIGMIFNPAEPGIAAGRGFMGAIAKPRAAAEVPLNVQAAQAANEAGASLPGSIVSPKVAIRATGKAAESLPLVGPGIAHQIGKSVEAVGERTGELANELRQGAIGRADVGEAVRPGIGEAIKANKDAMSEEYGTLRKMFDTSQQFELPETKAVLDNILKSRAKMKNPMEGLGDIAELVRQPAAPEMGPTVLRGMKGLEDVGAKQPWGANFDELQRARSEFGRKTQYGEPHPGYNEGERKALYGAMSQDMENIARQGGGEEAITALKTANQNAQKYIETNTALNKLANKSSNEGLAGSLMGLASETKGNISLLGQLRGQLPKEQFQVISGQLLNELGHNPATNSFSLNQFTTNWNKLSSQAKDVLFDPSHRKTLDGFANMGKFLKDADKYRNTSNTAHSVGWFAILEHLGDAVAQAFTGNFKPAMGTVAGLGAGAVFGKMLARPASAAAIAKWTRAAQSYSISPSIRNRVAVNLATKSLVDNLSDVGGISRNKLILSLGQSLGPKQANASGNNPAP